MLMWSTVEVLKSTPSCAEAAVPVAARAASPRTRSRRLSEPFSKRATRLEIVDSMAVSFRAGWTWRKDHSAPRHGAQGRGAIPSVFDFDLSAVMAGLVPAIHALLDQTKKGVDARDDSAFTRVFDALCAGMT